MAFRRILSTRATLVAKRHQASLFACIVHKDDRKHHPLNQPHSHPIPDNLFRQRCFATGFSNSSSGLGVLLLQHRRCPKLSLLPSPNPGSVSSCRYMSTVLDAIRAFHPFTLFSFLLSAGATFWIRLVTLRIFGEQLEKDVSEDEVTVGRNQGANAKQGMGPEAVAEGQEEEQKLFKEFGVTEYNPLRGRSVLLLLYLDCFVYIIQMVEMALQYKYGGGDVLFSKQAKFAIFPDPLGIFPAFWTVTFFITVGVDVADRSAWTASSSKVSKNVGWAFVAFMVPWTLYAPRPSYVYTTTANLVFITYAAMRDGPGVKKALGVSKILRKPFWCSK